MVTVRERPWLPITGLGVGFTALFAIHVALREPLGLEWAFSAYTLSAALLLTAGGFWVRERDWPAADGRHVLRWMFVGLGCLLVLAGVTLGEEFVDTGTLRDPIFLTLHLGVMGALGGLVTGVYNARFRRRTRKHRVAERRFREVFETAPLPIVTVDFDGAVDVWNPAAERAFGWSAEELEGDGYPLVPPGRGDEAARHRSTLEAGDRIEGVATKRQHRDGRLLEVELWAAPLRDADGTPVGALFLFVETTDQRRRDQQLTVLRRILRHNLRTDLNVVIGYADQLAAEGDPETEATARTIRERGEHLAALSDTATRLVSRTERIETMDVVPRIRRVCENLRAEHPAATITTSLPAAAGVRAVTTIDEAFAEAIENAIVHAEADDPTVAVCVTADDESGFAHVRIRDRGPGIPLHEWNAIRAGTETNLHHASGVGLWLIHWLVTASGGDVTRSARDPRGTELDVKLPVVAGRDVAGSEADAELADADTTPHRTERVDVRNP